MSSLPRLALGTLQADVDSTAICGALLSLLDRSGLRVQSFRSRACFVPRDAGATVTGDPTRHLDSWLMPRELCVEVLYRGLRRADLALIEGVFDAGWAAPHGGSFDQLCRMLEVPCLALIDVSRVGDCRMPTRPEGVDGILLDRIPDENSYSRWRTIFESLWGVPVLGALPQSPGLRTALEGPTGEFSRDLFARLAAQLSRTCDVSRLIRLSTKNDFPYREADCNSFCKQSSSLRIAVAYDEVFHCYFPDVLDLLEIRGATVCDFSPLRDERLPHDTDIVYFGCGRPDAYAEALMENTCLVAALRKHLCNGQRIYAECGGLAYLSREIEFPDGRRMPMTGVLPVTARLNPMPSRPEPIELDLSADCWLGGSGQRLRGYRSSRWQLPTQGNQPPGPSACLIGRHQAIGSLLNLNFAAQPAVFDTFFRPHAAVVDREAAALAHVQ